MKQFTAILQTRSAISRAIENAITLAIEDVAKKLKSKLRECVDGDFYKQYSPIFYDRTYSLLNSAAYKMIDKNSADIFINTDVLHYLSSPYGVNGEDIALLASKGYHGNENIQTEERYWEDFIEYIQNNLSSLLKEALKKQGLDVI